MKAPLRLADTQINVGNALCALGEHQRDIGQIRLAITTLHDTLQVRTQSALPKDWATMQNDLGVAHRWLAELTREVAALDDAAKAYDLCLQERSKEKVPFNWAQTQWNLADLALLRYDFTPDPAHLATARDHALAAREVFALGSDHQTARCDDLLARIEALSAGSGAAD